MFEAKIISICSVPMGGVGGWNLCEGDTTLI